MASSPRRARATSQIAHASGPYADTVSSTFHGPDGRRSRWVVVNWCGHGQEFVPWPEKDGYWVLVPVVETVRRSRGDPRRHIRRRRAAHNVGHRFSTCPPWHLRVACLRSLRRRNACEKRGEADASGCQAREGEGQGRAPRCPQVAEERRFRVRNLEESLAEKPWSSRRRRPKSFV
jgi:hypothetical protein